MTGSLLTARHRQLTRVASAGQETDQRRSEPAPLSYSSTRKRCLLNWQTIHSADSLTALYPTSLLCQFLKGHWVASKDTAGAVVPQKLLERFCPVAALTQTERAREFCHIF